VAVQAHTLWLAGAMGGSGTMIMLDIDHSLCSNSWHCSCRCAESLGWGRWSWPRVWAEAAWQSWGVGSWTLWGWGVRTCVVCPMHARVWCLVHAQQPTALLRPGLRGRTCVVCPVHVCFVFGACTAADSSA